MWHNSQFEYRHHYIRYWPEGSAVTSYRSPQLYICQVLQAFKCTCLSNVLHFTHPGGKKRGLIDVHIHVTNTVNLQQVSVY